MSTFELHPRLQQDCFLVGRLALSQLLMMNDKQYPWFILVPQRTDMREIYELPIADRMQLLEESCLLAQAIKNLYQPDKLNIACIGNLVPQLHLHHVARYRTDRAWPAPIWGQFPAETYEPQSAEIQLNRVRHALRQELVD